MALRAGPERRLVAAGEKKCVAFGVHELKPVERRVEYHDAGAVWPHVLDKKGGLFDEEGACVTPEQPVVLAKLLQMTIDEVGLPQPVARTLWLAKDLGMGSSK